jgi:hypothetical protein
MNENHFARLASINVNDHVEKKNGFSYLSWPYAVAQLRLADPNASWEVKRFEGLPFLRTECGYFVEVAVAVAGLTLSQLHPVLDGRNRPIEQPTSFDINTAIQRCLVKAIALHGLGLYLYAGEDLPEALDEGAPPPTAQPAPSNSPHGGRASANQLKYIRSLISETGADLDRMLEHFGLGSLEELTPSAASRVIEALRGKSRRAA